MNRRWVAAVSLAAVCLTGCSKSAQSTPSAPKSVGDLHLATPSTYNRTAYLFGLKSTPSFSLRKAGDDNLVLIGESVCKLFDNGYSLDDVASRMIGAVKKVGGTADDAATLTSAAVVNLCPRHLGEVPH